MISYVIFLVFGMLLGSALTCLLFLQWDKDEENQRKEIIRGENVFDSWCKCNCKCYEQYMNDCKDPDDAFRELDFNCCSDCPLIKAQLLLYKEDYRR